MNKLIGAAAVALAMTAGAARAQTTTLQTTTTVVPRPVAPVVIASPDGTLSVTRTQKTIRADGTQTESNETTYRNSNGVADDSVTRTTTIPPPQATSTTRSTTTITR